MEDLKDKLKAELSALRPGVNIGTNIGIETLQNRINAAKEEDAANLKNGGGDNSQNNGPSPATTNGGTPPEGGSQISQNQTPTPEPKKEEQFVTAETLGNYPEGSKVIIGDFVQVANYKVEQFEKAEQEKAELKAKLEEQKQNDELNRYKLDEKRLRTHGENYVVAVNSKTGLETVFSAKAWSRLSPKDKDGWARKTETPKEAL